MRLWSMILVASFVVGCSSGDDSSQESPTTAAPTVDAVLQRSAESMSDIETVRFDIERSGAPVAIDDGGAVVFDSASGHYRAPASAEATVTVQAGGVRAEVAAIAIDGSTWITNPLTGAWGPAPAEFAFHPAKLFDPEEGLTSLLSGGLGDARLADPSPDAEGRYLVQGTVQGERVSVLTGGLVDTETEIDVWIDADTSRVDAARFDVAGPDGVSTWDLQLDDYGTDVTITAPDVGGGG